MTKDTEKKAKDLFDAISNDDIVQETNMITKLNQVDALRSDIFDFFKDRMMRIRQAEILKMKAQEALEDQLDTGELNFQQILTIFTTASRESRNSAEAIISLFKPVPGANSILADSLGNAQKPDDYEEMFESMSQDELRKIDGLYKMLKSMIKKESEEKED